MLGIGSPLNMRICLLAHLSAHLEFDPVEIGNVAVVHDGVGTKYKGVVVDGCYSCASCGANMSEYNVRGSVVAYRTEVRVVQRWLDSFV